MCHKQILVVMCCSALPDLLSIALQSITVMLKNVAITMQHFAAMNCRESIENKQKSLETLWFQGISVWRRGRDSNPRDAFNAYTISSRAPSASSATSPIQPILLLQNQLEYHT